VSGQRRRRTGVTRTLISLRERPVRTSERDGTLLPALAALAAVGLVLFNTLQVARRHERLAADLVARGSDDDRRFEAADLEGLPAPVRRYFETVLEEGRPRVRSVRMEQRGEFRLGDPGWSWRPMEATQHVTVDPPGFVWSATVSLLPFVPVRVLDAYDQGSGVLRARLLSTVTVADVGPDPETNEAEPVGYLAEAVWFPTALLPAEAEWTLPDGNRPYWRAEVAHIEHRPA